jgi:hypothetical protein
MLKKLPVAVLAAVAILAGAPAAKSDTDEDRTTAAFVDMPFRVSPTLTGAAGTTARGARQVNAKTDFGAVGNGRTDDAAAIQAAIDALPSGGTIYLPRGTYRITRTLNLLSNQTLEGEGRGLTTIVDADGDRSQIGAFTKSRVAVRNLTVSVDRPGRTATIGGIHYENCDYCVVEGVEVTGVSWAGIYFQHSSHGVIRDNYTHDFRGSVQDSADIFLADNSTHNLVEGNRANAQNWHGIIIQDRTESGAPMYNRVIGNRVGRHTAYGIIVYELGHGDNHSQIIGNTIEDIQGTSLSNSSGMCIYVVGAGGVVVQDNTLRNCMVETKVLSLPVGAIGMGDVAASFTPGTITRNRIEGVTKFFSGIQLINSPGGATISQNDVTVPAANKDGFAAIAVRNSSNATVTGNRIRISNDAINHKGIMVFADGGNQSNITVAGNIVEGGDGAQIMVTQNGGFNTTDLTITDNTVSGGSGRANNYGLQFTNVVRGRVTGNRINSRGSSGAVWIGNATNSRFSGNSIVSGGATGIVADGRNTGSLWDRSNQVQGRVSNAGSGLTVEREAGAGP